MKILERIKMSEDELTFTAEELTEMMKNQVKNDTVKVLGFYNHSKAGERYVLFDLVNADHSLSQWAIPYSYRRTATEILTPSDLCSYLSNRITDLNPDKIEIFKQNIRGQLSKFFGSAPVTIPIFKKLLNGTGEWIWNKTFKNPNPQRRIQEIKEKGFTLATKIDGKKTYHMLLPFQPVEAPTYETIPTKIRRRIFEILNYFDAYSAKKCTLSTLPDHKFPEIRWDKDTAVSNDNLTDEEIKKKFQLIPERINQMKREVCRKCFQTGERGRFGGIDFFYSGTGRWADDVPTKGKIAEKGCVGCFWYDMVVWRTALNKLIEETR